MSWSASMFLLLVTACVPDDPVEGSASDSGPVATGDADADTDADADADTDADTDTDTGTADVVVLASLAGGGASVEHLDWEYVEEDCPTDCTGNTDPVLDGALYVVDGVVQVAAPTTMVTTLAILVPFSDAECNLHCGGMSYGLTMPRGQGEGSSGSLQSNLPCDTTSSDVYLGFDIGIIESGDYTWSVRVDDACGGTSARVEGAFTLP